MINRFLYINLSKDKERRFQLEDVFKRWTENEFTLERIEGVYWSSVDEFHQSEFTDKIDYSFRCPSKKTRINLGEVGCSLSHIKAWKRIIELDEPCVILEDDVQCCSYNLLMELEKIEYNEEIDLIYLGRQPLEPENELEHSKTFLVPNRSWLAHAYWLTPRGAKKLLDSGFEDSLIIVDEFIPDMIQSGKLNALAYKDDLFKQKLPVSQERIEDSRIEGTPQIFPNNTDPSEEFYSLLTVAWPENEIFELCESIKDFKHWEWRANITQNWDGGNMKGPGGGTKPLKLKESIENISKASPDCIVIFTDGYDVVPVQTPIQTIEKFVDEFDDGSVLFGFETILWPYENEEYREFTEPHFLNSGCFIGRAKNVKKMLDLIPTDFKDSDDDQHLFQLLHQQNPDLIKLDKERKIFLNLSDFQNDTLCHSNNGIVSIDEFQPCFVHGNGGEFIKGKFEYFASKIKEIESIHWIGIREFTF